MVEDRVDGNGGLAGLAVANDELTLATANWGHGVDSLDARLQWFVHRLAANDAGGLDFHTAERVGVDWSLAVNWLTERVDHAAQQAVANWHGQNTSRCLDDLVFFQGIDETEHDGTNGVFVQVHGEAKRSVFELQELVHGAGWQTRHAGDTVADFDNASDHLRASGGLEVGDVALERRGNFIGANGEFSHQDAPSLVVVSCETNCCFEAATCSRSTSNRPRSESSSRRSPISTTTPAMRLSSSET